MKRPSIKHARDERPIVDSHGLRAVKRMTCRHCEACWECPIPWRMGECIYGGPFLFVDAATGAVLP